MITTKELAARELRASLQKFQEDILYAQEQGLNVSFINVVADIEDKPSYYPRHIFVKDIAGMNMRITELKVY